MKATPEMIAAGVKAARKYMEETGGNNPAVIWDAMWAAQPAQQEPVAWGNEPWMSDYGVRVGRDTADCIDLIFTKVYGQEFQLYANEAAYLRDLLNKADIPGYTSPPASKPLTDGEIDLRTSHIYHRGRPVDRDYRICLFREAEAAHGITGSAK